MYYKGEPGLLALSSNSDKEGTLHFQEGGYNGLSKPFELKPGASIKWVATYSGHYDGQVMMDEKYNKVLSFYYNSLFPTLSSVVDYAIKNQDENLARSQKFENVLTRSAASPEEKWIAALSFHTDQANSMLLQTPEGEPRFYLTEGRFRHMNTIDVAHETELVAVFAPWRLKLQIATWLDYMATAPVMVESIRNPDGTKRAVHEGYSAGSHGPYLYHDVGDFPFVMKATAYNFGPFMAVEENANFSLLLYWYWKMTGDDAFVKKHLGTLEVLMHSLVNRDNDGSGLADEAVGWSTYDVSDALKRSSENVFLGVKQMTGYLAAAEMFESLPIKGKSAELVHGAGTDGDNTIKFGDLQFNNEALRKRQAAVYRAEAEKIAKTLKKAHKKYKYLPVSLKKEYSGWDQKCVVLAEGLFLPGLSGLVVANNY